jgi:hypothetical protein
MIILPIVNSRLRNCYPFQLIIILAILDFLWNCACLISSEAINSDTYCNWQAAFIQIFNLSDILWTAFLSFEMYNVVYKEMPKLMYGYIKPLICILALSSISSILPLILHAYGQSGAWCWINKPKYSKSEILILRITMLYGPVWIVITWNIFVSVKVYLKMKNYFNSENKYIVNKLVYYPLILLICYTPITISRVFNNIFISQSFDVFAECILMTEGVLNMIVYGLSKEVRLVIKEMFAKKPILLESNNISMLYGN